MNTNIDPVEISSWDTVTETVTKPTGTDIKYKYSTDSGRNYNDSWLTASELQTALRDIDILGVDRDVLSIKFLLSTTDANETPEIDLLSITSTYQTMVHDIDTIINYVVTQWREGKIKPVKIFRQQGETNSTIRLWMYSRAIELIEDETYYELADITGNIDRQNDTVLKIKIQSKTRPNGGSYDDHIKEMFDEFLYNMYKLAKVDEIGTYVYLFANTKQIFRSRYKSRLEFMFLLTRKGRGHDT